MATTKDYLRRLSDPVSDFSRINTSNFKPRKSIIIGCGGYGTRATNLLKTKVLEYFPEGYPGIDFICLDTDAPMVDHSGVSLVLDKTELIRVSCANVLELARENRYISQWFPRLEEWEALEGFKRDVSSTSVAAATTRCLGRVSMFNPAVIQEFNNALQRAWSRQPGNTKTVFGDEVRPDTGNNTIYFYIVASMGGGTGAGTIQDVSALIRHFTKLQPDNERPVSISVVLVTPEDVCRVAKYDGSGGGRPSGGVERVRGNGYAMVKEIDHFLHGNSFEVEYHDNLKVKIRNETANDLLFNHVYLIDGENDNHVGSKARNHTASLICDVLFNLTMTQVGEHVYSKIADVVSGECRYIREVPDIDGVSEKRRTLYSTFGISTLEVPNILLCHYFDREVAGTVAKEISKQMKTAIDTSGQVLPADLMGTEEMIDFQYRSGLKRLADDTDFRIFLAQNPSWEEVSQGSRAEILSDLARLYREPNIKTEVLAVCRETFENNWLGQIRPTLADLLRRLAGDSYVLQEEILESLEEYIEKEIKKRKDAHSLICRTDSKDKFEAGRLELDDRYNEIMTILNRYRSFTSRYRNRHLQGPVEDFLALDEEVDGMRYQREVYPVIANLLEKYLEIVTSKRKEVREKRERLRGLLGEFERICKNSKTRTKSIRDRISAKGRNQSISLHHQYITSVIEGGEFISRLGNLIGKERIKKDIGAKLKVTSTEIRFGDTQIISLEGDVSDLAARRAVDSINEMLLGHKWADGLIGRRLEKAGRLSPIAELGFKLGPDGSKIFTSLAKDPNDDVDKAHEFLESTSHPYTRLREGVVLDFNFLVAQNDDGFWNEKYQEIVRGDLLCPALTSNYVSQIKFQFGYAANQLTALPKWFESYREQCNAKRRNPLHVFNHDIALDWDEPYIGATFELKPERAEKCVRWAKKFGLLVNDTDRNSVYMKFQLGEAIKLNNLRYAKEGTLDELGDWLERDDNRHIFHGLRRAVASLAFDSRSGKNSQPRLIESLLKRDVIPISVLQEFAENTLTINLDECAKNGTNQAADMLLKFIAEMNITDHLYPIAGSRYRLWLGIYDTDAVISATEEEIIGEIAEPRPNFSLFREWCEQMFAQIRRDEHSGDAKKREDLEELLNAEFVPKELADEIKAELSYY